MKAKNHENQKNLILKSMVKKLSLFMFAICMMAATPSQAQFGKLLAKVKGKSGAGKKSGNFSTVWESEFENKATRLALRSEERRVGKECW